MKEYTLASIVSLFLPFILEAFFKTRIFKKTAFYVFAVVMFLFMILVNGYLTSVPVFSYNADSISGFGIGTIPIEDFFFAFSMLISALILWERFK